MGVIWGNWRWSFFASYFASSCVSFFVSFFASSFASFFSSFFRVFFLLLFFASFSSIFFFFKVLAYIPGVSLETPTTVVGRLKSISTRLSSARLGSAQLSPAQLGSAWLGLAQLLKKAADWFDCKLSLLHLIYNLLIISQVFNTIRGMYIYCNNQNLQNFYFYPKNTNAFWL